MSTAGIIKMNKKPAPPALCVRMKRENLLREDEKNNEEWSHGRVESGYVASLPTRGEDEESAGGVGMCARTNGLATPTTTQQ